MGGKWNEKSAFPQRSRPCLSAQTAPAREFDALYGRNQMRVSDLDGRKADIKQMTKLARLMQDPVRQTRARIEDIKTIRFRDADTALPKAQAALKKARQLGNRDLEADALYALGLSYQLKYEDQAAVDLFRQALSMYLELGNHYMQGHVESALGSSLSSSGSVNEATKHFQRATKIFQNYGDWLNEAWGLTSLGLLTNDLAQQLDFLSQSLQIHQELGLFFPIAIDYNNLSISYHKLGLYRKARELGEMSVQIARDENKDGLSFSLETLARPYLALKNYEKALGLLEEGLAVSRKLKIIVHEASYLYTMGRLALAQGKFIPARKYLRASLNLSQQSSDELDISSTLAWLAAVELAVGKEKAADKYSERAIIQLKKTENATYDLPVQEVWWWRYKVLLETKSRNTAVDALQRARSVMLDQVANISDEGLRRNYLNKVEINRDILLAWAKASQKRKLPLDLPETRAGSLAEQIRRVTEIGAQLNEHHNEEELLQLILDEAVELSGAERAMLLLADGSGALVPASGYLLSNKDLISLAAEASDLTASVARSRQPVLSEDPESTSKKTPDYLKRMRLAVPLMLRGQLSGVLYTDMRRLFGKLNEEDLNLLSVFCNQAASALENARLVSGLEQKVRERTEQLEERVSELEIINSIQQGLAAELDFQAIVDLVGDKLREVFNTPDLSITWYDEKANLIHYLYLYEHSKRLN